MDVYKHSNHCYLYLSSVNFKNLSLFESPTDISSKEQVDVLTVTAKLIQEQFCWS